MRNFLLALVFIAVSFSVNAQSDKIDDRLLVKFSIEELNKLKIENPTEFKFINYCLDNAWYIQSLPIEKMKDPKEKIGLIAIKDLNNINFYSLNITIIKDNYQFFAIEGTDKMLVIKSEYHILKELNK